MIGGSTDTIRVTRMFVRYSSSDALRNFASSRASAPNAFTIRWPV